MRTLLPKKIDSTDIIKIHEVVKNTINSKCWNNNCIKKLEKIETDKAKLRVIGGRKATDPELVEG